jgi:anti-anti-sigma regulatory factor
MMRFLIAACLVLSCGLCLAEDFPKDTNEIKSLTAEQAADFVMVVTHIRKSKFMSLHGLTSIDKDVAQELAKYRGATGLGTAFKGRLNLGLTSINKEVAQELAKFKGSLSFESLTSIDKEVAQELAKFKGTLSLNGLTSIDKDVAQELAKFKGSLWLMGMTSIDKNVAQELAKFEGQHMSIMGSDSLDEVTQAYLRSSNLINLAEPRPPKGK